MSKIHTVIFDWAGTTIDYGCFAPVKAFIESFKSFGIEPTIEETRQPMGMLKLEHIKTMLEMERIKKSFYALYEREPNAEDAQKIHSVFAQRLMGVLADYTDLKPYVCETIQSLNLRDINIGSTTGYTDEMMRVVTRETTAKGYIPDCWVSADSTGGKGRPYPYMIFKNLEKLGAKTVEGVIKVGDTVADIQEGKNAGVISVGVLEGSSVMGLTLEEYEALTEAQKTVELHRAERVFIEAGADYVIRDIRGVLDLI